MPETNSMLVNPRADTVVLTRVHQNEKDKKIRLTAMEKGCSGVLVFQVENIAYASGLILPYAEQYAVPHAAAFLPVDPSNRVVVILPPDWARIPLQQNLDCRTVVYTAHSGLPPHGLLKSLAQEVIGLGLGKVKIGLDMNQCSEAVLGELVQALPDVKWVDICKSLGMLQMVKTESEVDMLEEAVRQADRALVSAINHSEGCVMDSTGYSLWEFTERIRVHVGEFGGSAAGHLTTLQGSDMRVYSRAPHGNFVSGCPVRTESTSSHRGYWADMGRTLFVGKPGEEFLKAYKNNIFLKETALQAMRAGRPCLEVFESAALAAQQSGIDLWKEPGIGHGIGLSEREAPYLCPTDKTVLKPGMVLVLAIYTFGPQRELICSKDTYVVTENGSRLLSWYRNWDMLYCLYGNTARHG